MLGTVIPSLPWYTWFVLSALALVALGILRVLLLGIGVAIRSLFHAAYWMLLRWLSRYVSFGTAHWAGVREVAHAGLLHDQDGLLLGLWRGQHLVEPSGGHVAAFGPPRSRKSWGLITPNIRRYPGSVVVSDLRSELYTMTHEAREAKGPVYQFNPAGVESCSVNLLDAVRWQSPYAFGDVHRIVNGLLKAPRHETGTSAFREAAVPLLGSLIMYAYDQGMGNFPALVRWMLDAERDLDAKLKEVLASPNPLVSSGARRTLDASERLRASIWNAALAPLTIFLDPVVSSHTEKSDVLLSDLHHGIQPISLYLCMAFHDISRLGVFLGCLVEALTALLGSPTAPPRHKVLLVLDEIANLGYLPELERAVSYLQGSGTQVLMAFQNVKQAVRTFGEDSPLLSSIGTQVHYRPHDTSTAEWIAGYLGQATVTSTSVTYGQSAQGPSTSRTTSEHARTLLTPDEVLRLGPNEAIVLHQGCAPIRAEKFGAPLPTTRHEQVQASLWHWRWAVGAVGLALVLLVALWPLTRTGSVVKQPLVTGTPALRR